MAIRESIKLKVMEQAFAGAQCRTGLMAAQF